MNSKEMKKQLLSKRKKENLKTAEYLSTGSTLLNLAITGKPNKGFAVGRYYFLVGDSTSGKTFLSLTCLAEAAKNKLFKNHRFIFDNSEDGAMMDIKKFFGKRVYKRIQPPNILHSNRPNCSTSIEEFYYNVDDAIKANRPFIYILDSMDSLSSAAEQEKFDETKKAARIGKKVAGSYGDGKAKKNSTNLRRLLGPLKNSKSILIVISQTRDNLGFGFETKTRSGGNALRFYSTVEMWSSIKGRIKKTIKGKKRQLGILCKIKIKKNRITGREREVIIPIYHSIGIDDIGSCINFLTEEKHWPEKGSVVKASEFEFKGRKEKLIQLIEKNEWEMDLRDIVGDIWNEIEEACRIKRKPRYE